jgi:hypothetical protein
MSRPRRSHLVSLWASILLALVSSRCGGGESPSNPISSLPTPAPTATPVADPDPTIAAAGDIACDSTNSGPTICQQFATSELIVRMQPTAVLALGDLAYENGRIEEFQRFYDPSWGRLKPITRPAPGNHEYQTFADARGYFEYFNGNARSGGVAGSPGEGWYSFDIGSWHLVALNSNCQHVGGCGQGSAQDRWLRADLRANRTTCTLAFWHHPRFSSGASGNNPIMEGLWQTLQEEGADVVLSGHDHVYERFSPQTSNGTSNRERGLRQIVVGTGGRDLTAFVSSQANSEVKGASSFGILKMRLRPRSYEWEFLPAPGYSFRDSGSDVCH